MGIEHIAPCTRGKLSKGQNIFFLLKVVMLHIKLNYIIICSTMQAHIMSFHTSPNPRWNQKATTFFSESCHVAYKIQRNGA